MQTLVRAAALDNQLSHQLNDQQRDFFSFVDNVLNIRDKWLELNCPQSSKSGEDSLAYKQFRKRCEDACEDPDKRNKIEKWVFRPCN